MKRLLYKQLINWKNNRKRKPLLLQGARQVGKTYLINLFATTEYKNYIYLNFEEKPDLISLFQKDLNPAKIIENISFYIGRSISSENTLLFFDEIQAAPIALTSLKYFSEKAPQFHIIAAGSLLGVSIGKKTPFPVGKVNFLTLYPMSFIEYLMAFEEELLAEKLMEKKTTDNFPKLIHDKLNDYLKKYFFLGGMPEVLQDFKENGKIENARRIQLEILKAYENDFSKYSAKKQAIKTSELWNSIPYQLAKENKKFKYADIKKHARSSTYEATIEWLNKAGLIHISNSINKPALPLSGYSDNSKFKLFLLDTGLLGAMLGLPSSQIIKPTQIFAEYNGAFTENYVATQLVSIGYDKLFYWTSKSKAEVDFIIQQENSIFPIEVKSGLSKNKSSLISYSNKYNPTQIYRLSPRNFIKSNIFINLPLYAVSFFG